ncbi:MAG: response regulator [Streptosporangiaceae bacterium]|jgi:ActR/RegA family two-component response regulator
MTSILLVDDDRHWLKLIRRALPDYDVDQAESYTDALALLDGSVYDVAIVDLNLLAPGSDRLGGRLLEIMRENYPSMRRIALTGVPLTSVRVVLDQYDVDDLLLKDRSINLAVVREVVEAALKRTTNDIPRDLRAEKSEMLASARSWNADILVILDQRARTWRNDVLDAEREGIGAEDSERKLADLHAVRQDLGVKYAELIKLVSGVRTRQDLTHAAQVFERLKSSFSG